MKVHPVSTNNRTISLRYDVSHALARSTTCRQKKLRRLPHIFAKVLELPFHSEADILIEETTDSLRFTAATNGITADVRADTIDVYTGVTKIVVRGTGIVDSGTEFELDLWRFRLPACTRPEMASAVYYDGELVVTVPKGADELDEEGGIGGRNLVLVM